MTTPPPSRLGDTGRLELAASVIADYARARGLAPDLAGPELAEHLAQATRPVGAVWRDGAVEEWRFRRRSAGVDITARVQRVGERAIVIAVSVRGGYSPRRGGRGRPR